MESEPSAPVSYINYVSFGLSGYLYDWVYPATPKEIPEAKEEAPLPEVLPLGTVHVAQCDGAPLEQKRKGLLPNPLSPLIGPDKEQLAKQRALKIKHKRR